MKKYNFYLLFIISAALLCTGCNASPKNDDTSSTNDVSIVETTENATETTSESMTETQTESITETMESVTETMPETDAVQETETDLIETTEDITETETEIMIEESSDVTDENDDAEIVDAEETAPYDYFWNSRHETPSEYEDWIFVGDSRTVLASHYVAMTYYAKSGEGIKWFRTIEDEVYAERNKNIVFNLGVNDLHNLNAYIDLYWNLPQDFVDNNHIIVMSVNPCGKTYAYLNPQIEWFNENLQNNLPDYITYADCYGWLINEQGFDTTDGLHYEGWTYQDIHWFASQF